MQSGYRPCATCRVWRPGDKPVGLALVRLMVVVFLVLGAARVFAKPLGIKTAEWPSSGWENFWSGRMFMESSELKLRMNWNKSPATTGDCACFGQARSAGPMGIQRCGSRCLQSRMGLGYGRGR